MQLSCKFKRVAFSPTSILANRQDRKADMLSAFTESLIDSLKLIPFLFVTYLVMGMLERAASEKAQHAIMEAGKIGPIWGGLLGAIPQCGFSAAASYFYVGKVITLGTLISIYLSTSDELLPIFISEKVAVSTIVSILATKVIIGMVSGFIVEFVLGWLAKRRKVPKDFDMEPDRGCSRFLHPSVPSLSCRWRTGKAC